MVVWQPYTRPYKCVRCINTEALKASETIVDAEEQCTLLHADLKTKHSLLNSAQTHNHKHRQPSKRIPLLDLISTNLIDHSLSRDTHTLDFPVSFQLFTRLFYNIHFMQNHWLKPLAINTMGKSLTQYNRLLDLDLTATT